MARAVEIFLTGILGVFTGMTVLYCAIKLNTQVTERFFGGKENK